MAAMLCKNGPDGKPLAHTGLLEQETVACPNRLCSATYNLSFGVNENRMEDGVNVLQEIRRTAVEKINETHPHAIGPDTYVWGGVKKGWLDREEATAAGM